MPCFAGTDLPPKNLILTYYFVFPLTEQSFQNLKIFLALKYLSQRLLVYKALLLLLMLYVIASLVVLIPMCM
jgi:hypothetical protein